ncbi:hypothetical protein P9294_gp120 [Bacillus phage FADO]|uniref:Uncharacterized protein n=1 Tax=Bacillus phage FADO TaxID=2917160 RepID=A0AAE9K5T9_9CAUD|nr:hypothetical protein P9294_gp120 [Bacillus phage FADO]UNY48835.1 hypothetical protein fado_120 [Bacillus phage FADO]
MRDKKIIRIKNGEFILDITKDGVLTTYKRDSAMDISGWAFDKLAFIISNLKKVGYKDVKIITVPSEKKESKKDKGDKE